MTRRHRTPLSLDTMAFGVVLSVILAALLACAVMVIDGERVGDGTAQNSTTPEATST